MTQRARNLMVCAALMVCGGPGCDGGEPALDAAPRTDGGARDADPTVDGGEGLDGGRDSGPRPDGGPVPTTPCEALSLAAGTSVSGYLSDVVTWRDADCLPRSAALVHNDVRDPSGHYGGLVRRFTYEVAGATRMAESTNDGHPGFGEVVNHFGSSASISSAYAGTFETLLAGPHHLIHEYRWRYAIDGHDVTVIVHWFFATGRDHPVYAITFDLTGVPDGAVNADSRAPYGDVAWDGGGGTPVSGVGWGDRRRFVSLDAPISMSSGWSYEETNRVPYAMEWTVAPDAEMGLVQTQTWEQHSGGGYWFYSAWGTRDDDGPMPEDWNWTYQLNQYELPFAGGNASKRLSWGMNYGAVGSSDYSVYGDDGTESGWPYQSYSTFVVLGARSESAVLSQVGAVEAMVDAEITASVGTVVTSGAGGVGRADSVARDVPGYDPRYAAWELRAAANAVTVTLTPSAPLHWPVLEIHDWTAGAPSHVTLNGVEVPAAASVDAATSTLWLTVVADVSTASEIAVE